MKTMFLAAAATILVLGGAAQAKPVEPGTRAIPAPAILVAAKHNQTQLVTNPLANENLTGIPAYEMRPDGLMINGLLPAQGWES